MVIYAYVSLLDIQFTRLCFYAHFSGFLFPSSIFFNAIFQISICFNISLPENQGNVYLKEKIIKGRAAAAVKWDTSG